MLSQLNQVHFSLHLVCSLVVDYIKESPFILWLRNMDLKKVLINGGLVICVIVTLAMTILLLAYFFGDAHSQIQYYEADRAEPSSRGDFGVPVFSLNETEFANHPVFNELITDKKKVLFSLEPEHIIRIAQANFKTLFDNGKAYSSTILPDEENRYLSQLDMHVVSFRGRFYYIRKEGARPWRPCGNGIQC